MPAKISLVLSRKAIAQYRDTYPHRGRRTLASLSRHRNPPNCSWPTPRNRDRPQHAPSQVSCARVTLQPACCSRLVCRVGYNTDSVCGAGDGQDYLTGNSVPTLTTQTLLVTEGKSESSTTVRTKNVKNMSLSNKRATLALDAVGSYSSSLPLIASTESRARGIFENELYPNRLFQSELFENIFLDEDFDSVLDDDFDFVTD